MVNIAVDTYRCLLYCFSILGNFVVLALMYAHVVVKCESCSHSDLDYYYSFVVLDQQHFYRIYARSSSNKSSGVLDALVNILIALRRVCQFSSFYARVILPIYYLWSYYEKLLFTDH